MTNPPAGWYPDPTGAPDTIRWWNGTQWTTRTETETPAEDPTTPTPAQSTQVEEARQAEAGQAEEAQRTADEPVAWQQPVGTEEPDSTQTPAWEQGQSSQSSQTSQTSQTAWEQPAPDNAEQTPSWEQPDADESAESQGPWAQDRSGQSGQAAGWPDQAQSGQAGAQTSWDQGQSGQGGQSGGAAGWDQPQSGQGGVQTSWDQWDQGQSGQGGQGGAWAQGQGEAQGNPWGQGGQQWSGGEFGQGPLRPAEPDDDGGGGRLRLPLLITAAVVLVLVVVGGVWLIVGRGGDDPQTQNSPDPSQSTGDSPTGTPSGATTPGQSRNPSLHEGNRSASDAISFPRQPPTKWSDRKRFARAVIDSSGQYSVLQSKVDGKNDWYANIFVGALGTSILYNGNLRSTANDLAIELRNSFYDPIPVTARQVSSRPIEVGGHKGWRIVQGISTKTKGVKSPNLYLTTAVFDLGDGTAVAWVSDIPANRSDLRANEQAAFKGLHIG